MKLPPNQTQHEHFQAAPAQPKNLTENKEQIAPESGQALYSALRALLRRSIGSISRAALEQVLNNFAAGLPPGA